MLIDIGNARTKLARWKRGKLTPLQAVPTEHLISGRADIAHFLSEDDQTVAISSVVPDALPAVTAAVAGETDAPVRLATLGAASGAGAETRLAIPIRTNVDEPARVGTDRLLAALAAYARFARPLVIVGFGSALTFDCVDGGGVFLGGLIFPGPRLCAKALARQTAALPEIDVSEAAPVIGRNTEEAIRVGIFRGIANAVSLLRPSIPVLEKTPGSLSPHLKATPRHYTTKSTAHAATWRTGSKSNNSTFMPIEPVVTNGGPINFAFCLAQ